MPGLSTSAAIAAAIPLSAAPAQAGNPVAGVTANLANFNADGTRE